MSPRRTMRPPTDEVGCEDVLLGLNAPETRTEQNFVAGLDVAGRPDDVLGLERRDDGGTIDAEIGELLVENSTKIRSSCAPRISIFETSGTCRSLERTSST